MCKMCKVLFKNTKYRVQNVNSQNISRMFQYIARYCIEFQ